MMKPMDHIDLHPCDNMESCMNTSYIKRLVEKMAEKDRLLLVFRSTIAPSSQRHQKSTWDEINSALEEV
jgi:hypothetical protein